MKAKNEKFIVTKKLNYTFVVKWVTKFSIDGNCDEHFKEFSKSYQAQEFIRKLMNKYEVVEISVYQCLCTYEKRNILFKY